MVLHLFNFTYYIHMAKASLRQRQRHLCTPQTGYSSDNSLLKLIIAGRKYKTAIILKERTAGI